MWEICVKGVLIWNFSGPYLLAFKVNTKVHTPCSVRMQEDAEQKTPGPEIFHAVKHAYCQLSLKSPTSLEVISLFLSSSNIPHKPDVFW